MAQIYIDDIIFDTSSDKSISNFIKIIHNEFEMSMVGELNFFLGLQIKQIK